jgi:hypothetical protein
MASDGLEVGIRGVWFLIQLMLLIIGLLILPGIIAERKVVRERQKKAMAAKASELGMRLSGGLPSHLLYVTRHLNELDVSGDNRYAFNIMDGEYSGHPVFVFDYHYRTKGDWFWAPSWRKPNYVCVALVDLEKHFPELIIGPEGGGLFDMIAEAFGGGDIDFESHEFSEAFDVRSKDKKFAYDFCNAQMIDYLLANKDLSLEVDQKVLAVGSKGMHNVNKIESRLQKLAEIRDRMPNYLFEGAHG